MACRLRNGFTLIELLVVMGVVLILSGIAIIGYTHLDRISAEKLTRTRLEFCKAMLQEYESQATLAAIEGVSPAIYAYNPSAAVPAPPITPNPGDVNFGATSRYTGAVSSTAQIFQQLSRTPIVKTMLAQLPGESILQNSTGSGAWVDANSIPLPVVVDGWNNPIIYVASGGLANVYVGGNQQPSGVSAGIWGHAVTVKSVDGRPFWASAGADGSFTNGDDNLYSSPVSYR